MNDIERACEYTAHGLKANNNIAFLSSEYCGVSITLYRSLHACENVYRSVLVKYIVMIIVLLQCTWSKFKQNYKLDVLCLEYVKGR